MKKALLILAALFASAFAADIEVYQANGTKKKVTPSGVTISTAGAFTVSAAITGTTTNDSAGAGIVGQIISAIVPTGTPIPLTTATGANVTSLSLTAGDWDVSGNVNFNLTGATATAFAAGISSTSATIPTDGTEVESGVITTVVTGKNGITLPTKRFSLSGTTTVYLVAKSTFAAGSESAYGSIVARRRR